MKRVFLSLALAWLASACFRFETSWERIDSAPFLDPQGEYRMELPVGWARCGPFLTRDGVALQTIVIGDGLSRDVPVDALTDPSQPDFANALESVIRGLRGSSRDITVVDSTRTTLAGFQALRVHTREQPRGYVYALFDALPEHTQHERVTYVVVQGERFFFFTYEAPALYYFERDLPTFERLVQSFEPLEPEGHSGP